MVHTSEAAAAVHAGPPGGTLGRISPPMSSLMGASGSTTGSKSRADVDSAERALIRVRQKLQVCVCVCQGSEKMIEYCVVLLPGDGRTPIYDCASS